MSASSPRGGEPHEAASGSSVHGAAGATSGDLVPGPPSLTGGAKCQVDERQAVAVVQIHWLQGSYVDSTGWWREKMTYRLSSEFGKPSTRGQGQLFYREGIRWENGAAIYWAPIDGGDHFTMVLPGKVWDGLTFAEAVDLVRDVGMGMKCTRIDVALDYRRERLIDDAWASVNRRELCWFRGVEMRESRDASTLEPTGRTLVLGSRQSETYGRLYDKGLESGDADAGELERLEVEFKGDRAAELLQQLGQVKEIGGFLASVALGAIDFREQTGTAHRERRPVARWWQRFVAGVDAVRLKVQRGKPTFDGWRLWLSKCTRSAIESISRSLGLTPGAVFEELTGGADVVMTSGRGELFVNQASEWLVDVGRRAAESRLTGGQIAAT